VKPARGSASNSRQNVALTPAGGGDTIRAGDDGIAEPAATAAPAR
jgi:hypothetical protein